MSWEELPVPNHRQTACPADMASFLSTAAPPGTWPQPRFSERLTSTETRCPCPRFQCRWQSWGSFWPPSLAPDKAMVTGMTRQPRASCTLGLEDRGQVEAQLAEDGRRLRASPGLLAKEVLPRQVQAQPARGQGGGPCGQALDKVTLGQGWAHGASSHPPRLQRGVSEANVPHSFP